jgi:cell division protein FtsL
MIRVLNFFCVALMGLSILALYNVSERTRLADVDLHKANQQILQERSQISVLETEWERVASPARVAMLAETKLGLDNTATVQLSSLELLPRRGEDEAPLSSSPVRRASIQVPAQPGPIQQIAARVGTQ